MAGAALVASLGCSITRATPDRLPLDARGGRAPDRFDIRRACSAWSDATEGDEHALSHVSFPELHPRGCFVRVDYSRGGRPRFDPPRAACSYPHATTAARLAREAERYEAIASGRDAGPLPLELACGLPADVLAVTARTNAATLRSLARRIRSGRAWPYAAASAFGFGHPSHAKSALVAWRPGDACTKLDKAEMDRLGVNVVRAHRAAEAHLAGIAPVVTVSGGAVHSPLYEAFLLHHLVTCRFGVRRDAVLLDSCADHTHTNVRNTGSLVIALGGRTAYVVTDDGFQGKYLQDWTPFSMIGGSVDQRALRDFGHLVGSWRRASTGIPSGFWFTPYRFWGDPRPETRDFTCVR